jgi:5-methylcytosine-specific restriction enzyme subunit McrC
VPELSITEWWSIGPEDERLRGRSIGSPEARRLVERLKGFLDIEELRDGLRITSFSYVGRVQVEDLTITIRPKLEAETLLALVCYAFSFRRLMILETARYPDKGSIFEDLLAAQLLSEARELIRSGPARQYREIHQDLAAPRGRIDFARLSSRPGWNRVAIPCRESPRSMDNLLNQALRAGIELAADLAQDRVLVRDLRATAKQLSEIAGPVELTFGLLAQADRAISRMTTSYRPALRLIELLRSSSRIDLKGEGELRLPGFLFDMNRFFQALVGRFLSDHLDSYEVADERCLPGFMRYLPGHNPRGHKQPLLRPDFTVSEGRKVVTFLDAKYRDLWEKNLPRETLYQLAVYALSRRSAGNAAIIYPARAGVGKEAIIEIAEPSTGESQARIALRPFDLNRAARIIMEENHCEGAEMARFLVCGRVGPEASRMAAQLPGEDRIRPGMFVRLADR